MALKRNYGESSEKAPDQAVVSKHTSLAFMETNIALCFPDCRISTRESAEAFAKRSGTCRKDQRADLSSQYMGRPVGHNKCAINRLVRKKNGSIHTPREGSCLISFLTDWVSNAQKVTDDFVILANFNS